ncbi:MAG: 30S ribosomal protein S5 [Candidatus Pacearchaeota archaeon]
MNEKQENEEMEIEKIEETGTEEKAEEKKATEEEREREEKLKEWKPKTELGKEVLAGKIKSIDEILDKNLKIFEPEIVDFLMPQLEIEIINIGQAKGKFGGGKRRPWRQTQKKTAEGNVPTFSCMCVVGDKNGHIGLGYGKAKETVPAKQKAIREAKLNMFRVKRGCGSFDCTCKEQHSIPVKVEGKEGSVRIVLMPAPRGTGLVADDECKKVFRLAGIKDIYTKSYGQTRTKINMIKACIAALKKLTKIAE